jgi:hypothetical protein
MANVIDLKKHPDTKDFGPRVGFTWDPYGHGKTVFRGGYGIYYDRIILETGAEERVQNDRALAVTQYAGSSCVNPGFLLRQVSACALRREARLRQEARRLPSAFSGPSQTGGVGIIAMGTGLAPSALSAILLRTAAGGRHQRGFSARMGFTSSASAVDRQFAAHHELHFARHQLPRQQLPCTITDPVTGISDNITLIQSGAKSWYDGLLVSSRIASRSSKVGYQYNVSYTLSKTLDYSDDDQLTNNNAKMSR